MNTKTASALSLFSLFACVSIGLVGCAADDGSSTSTGKNDEVTTTPAPPAPSPVNAPPASGAASRGTVVGTVMASEVTRKETGVTVWGTFKQDGTVTTYGFDKDGVVLSHLTLTRGSGAREVVITAQGTGLLRLGGDGSVLENTLKSSNKRALAAMSTDFQATGEDAAYGWFTWVRTGVFCAIAGGCGGANIAADLACLEGAIELLAE